MIQTITHLGNGKFQVETKDGEIKEGGPNLCGLVRYTYFEDHSLPEVGWKVTHSKLMEDYLPKVHRDIIQAHQDIIGGKIKPNQMNF